MTEKSFEERYTAAAHAIQAGVAMELELDQREKGSAGPASPKHLRTGVNMAMVHEGALANLLVTKKDSSPTRNTWKPSR